MKYFIVVAFCMGLKCALSQGVGEWTWMKGDSTYANDYTDMHSYGVKGTYSDSIIVPKLYGSVYWSNGNRLYLLGGSAPDLINYVSNSQNTMWEYNVDSNKWRWLKGEEYNHLDNFILDYWGIQGSGDSITFPVLRESSAGCTDYDGNFWLFGGYSENDLWEYNIVTNVWTWMKGSVFGIYHHYGTQGVPDSLNNPPPGPFGEMWADKQGNLWLYGGEAMSGYQWYQTVWRYNIATNVWTWMSGDTLPLTPPPVYDTLNVFNAINTPGGRENNSTHWVDSMGNFYVYGGFMFYPYGEYDDLWKYDVTLNQWACIKAESSASYISYCTTVNLPSGRSEATGWVDRDGY
ncbi:MAG: kelch repeat-containing protein, partial [Chitinophagales bacterium]